MKKIVVVMGGPSTEAEVSRRSGKAILHALLEKGYQAEALELDPPNFPQQIKASGADFVFNALHGKYGEDGIIQGTLDGHSLYQLWSYGGSCYYGQGSYQEIFYG